MNVLLYPLITEKTMDSIDFENKLVFIVDLSASKPEIKQAVEDHYDVSVTKVNTQITMKGTKKATVQLSAEDDAQDVISRVGVF
ncbi:MAG: 50S ribosomal protein L23 [Halobacteriales archaeon]|nr:50S ribosomal protein L23 [Halobacteriales archaeon]